MQSLRAPTRDAGDPGDPVGRAFTDADGVWSKQQWISRTTYWGIHAACLLVLVTGTSVADLALCTGLYWLRMFAITAGYHRYFAHRGYSTGRVFQFVLAVLGCLAVQKGPLWWAGGHRRHHRYSDRHGDLHSPRDGFWYAHQAWIFDGRWDDTELDRIRDFAKYPELLWLNRWHVVPPAILAVALFAFGGLSALVWGFAVSTTLVWHCTYSINSLAHRWGSQRYDTGDDSRNNLWLALLTMGEGWHNNHHHFQASARNGFFWWEIDLTYYVLLGLEKLGIVWELKLPPGRVLEIREPASLERAA
jgi:stearoyl-CoA desaturase (delta-9 desaturase)